MSIAEIEPDFRSGGSGSSGPGFDRTPPQDIAAEQSVLGGMLISKEHGGLGFSPQAQSLVLGKIA